MKRQGRIRVTFRGHAQDSYASLELPVEEIVSALVDFHGVHGVGVCKTVDFEGIYSNGDGVRVTFERVAKVVPQAFAAGTAATFLRNVEPGRELKIVVGGPGEPSSIGGGDGAPRAIHRTVTFGSGSCDVFVCESADGPRVHVPSRDWKYEELWVILETARELLLEWGRKP